MNVGEDVEKREPSCIAGENDIAAMEDSMEIPLKIRNKTTT